MKAVSEMSLCFPVIMVANITNDISLLRQIREGNEDAFKSLFETYFTPLCRFIYLHLDDKNVAEELAMDIFIYLWENRETFPTFVR